MKRDDLLSQSETIWDSDVKAWVWTLSHRLDRQRLTSFSLTFHEWMNSDYNDIQNWNWLSENHVYAACENVIWDDQLHTKIQADKMRKKDSEFNDADEEWWDTVTTEVQADAEWVSDDRICFVRQMLARNDELVSWQKADKLHYSSSSSSSSSSESRRKEYEHDALWSM